MKNNTQLSGGALLRDHTTQRLRFRELQKDDYGELMTFFNSPEATRFLFIEEERETYCKKWIERQIHRYRNEQLGLCALELKETRQFIGQCGILTQTIDGKKELEIGYHLLPRFWGKGYASEAAIACRDFAFKNLFVDSVVSIIHADNKASCKVALNNGMRVNKSSIFNYIPVDVYRITRAQWPGKSTAISSR
ncbi:MAG: GNAT family N-acetyltransferase [bacterium]|nr:GNAT family N-acetyltransferase [bacterium]